MVPLLIAMPIGSCLAWKRGDLLGAVQRLYAAAAATLVVLVAVAALHWRGPWLAPFGVALGVWVVAGAVTEWSARVKLFAAPFPDSLQRARGLPRAAYGSMLAHAGIGIAAIGIVATTAWQSEVVLAMKPGDRGEIAGYGFAFRGVAPSQGPNYQEQVGLLVITRPDGSLLTELSPSKRTYQTPPQTTTEAAIHVSWRGDLYAVLGDSLADGGTVVRFYFNPLVRLIWLGALVMAFGGLLSISDRRLRVGAPRRARRPMPAPSPAE